MKKKEYYLTKPGLPILPDFPVDDDDIIVIKSCPHKKTVAINEEGHAGVYCVNCGEQLEKEC